MRVVIDTNVFISGIFFGGAPRKVLDLIEEKQITSCFTFQTFEELKRLLYHEKFDKQRKLLSFPLSHFLRRLKTSSSFFIQPFLEPPLIIKEDPADNYILACAVSSQASFIVSGDNHLLKLKEFQGIPIVSPREFLKIIKTR